MSPAVQLFHTCLVNEVAPEVGMAAVRVLERRGFDVFVPRDQTCCGQPAYNAGFHDEARAVARHAVAVLEAVPGPIVVPSGSCADMIVHQYGVLLHDDPAWHERARAVASRTRELSQFLFESRPPGPPAPPGTAAPRVAYHPSCHLSRGLGVREPPLALLAETGVDLVCFDDQDECCGFGGVFSIKMPEISASIMDRKLQALEKARPERLVSCDLGCLLHLGGGLRRRRSPIKVQHLAEALDEAGP
ncbi:MAG TPA: (Fe-S)-binding protein [Vicinamibacteria bacterium]|nr:(Fe-S)-binding protein [Vicinamibacteria bacterium]